MTKKRCTLLGLLTLICVSLLLLNGCGGGGSSSAINPVPIPTTNPTAIPVPTSQTGTISGIITNALDGTPISGAEIKTNNTIVSTSGNDGHYSFQGTSGQLTISGGSMERSVYYSSTSPTKNISLTPQEVDPNALWAYYQWPNEKVIRKWKNNQPNEIIIYTYTIDTNSRINQEILDQTTSIIIDKLFPFAGFSNIKISTKEIRPQDDQDIKISSDGTFAYLTNEKVAISFISTMINANGKGNSFVGSDGFLFGGGVTICLLEKSISHFEYVLLHELLHATLHWYHPFENGSTIPSIMNYDLKYQQFTEMDQKTAQIYKKRMSGTTYPDNDPINTENYSSKKNIIPSMDTQLKSMHWDNL